MISAEDKNSPSHSSPKLHWYYHLTALTLLGFVTFLVYANSFKAPFVFDDIDNFVNRTTMQMTVISKSSLQRAAFAGICKNRIIPNLSLGLNYFFTRGEVWGYHLVNIVIHVLTAFMVYLLFFKTLLLTNRQLSHLHTAKVAFLAALLWAVHPLHTNVATYIVQRMTSFAALFMLGSLLCYLYARTSFKRPYFTKFLYLSALLFFIMALMSKENSIMLPVLVMAYEYYFLIGKEKAINYKYITFFSLTFGLLLYLVATVYVGANPLATIISGYSGRDFSLYERLLTEPRIIFHYISLIVLPLPSRLNLAYDYQISRSLFDPIQTIFSIGGIFLLIASCLLLFKQHKLLSLAIFWFLANLLIESTIVPLELIFEHRTYLPSIILILAFVDWIAYTTRDYVFQGRALVIAIIIFFSILTWQRNTVWSNEISFWRDVVNKSPNLPRGYVFLAVAYDHEGKYLDSYKLLISALSRNLDTYDINNNLGKAAANLGKNKEAIKYLERAVALESEKAESHYNLGIAYGNEGYKNQARQEMMLGMRLMELRQQ